MIIIFSDTLEKPELQIHRIFLDYPEGCSVCIILNNEGCPVAAVVKKPGFDIGEPNGYRDLMPEGSGYATV